MPDPFPSLPVRQHSQAPCESAHLVFEPMRRIHGRPTIRIRFGRGLFSTPLPIDVIPLGEDSGFNAHDRRAVTGRNHW
jgi:hypothetical protein